MGYGLGVDLGTSFTGAATSHDGQARMVALGEQSVLMPSVVLAQPDGSLLAGGIDHSNEDDPGRIGRDFKRRLGDPTPIVLGGQPHSAVSLLAATLKSVVAAVTELEGAAPDRVVLTYPAVWGPYRREQFAEVPGRAGLDSVTLLSEPEAAATHYAVRQQLKTNDVIAVYDLGGGTFDTTVTGVTRSGVEILGVPEGVEWVGGVDFDEAVVAHVDRAVDGALSALDPRDPVAAASLQRIRQECVRAKERLSRENATNITVLLPNRHIQVPLTRAEFEAMIRTPLESTLSALRRTLRSATMSPSDLAGVLLVGGSSRIPLVSTMLSEDLGRPVLLDPSPQHCVALGAAAIATGTPIIGGDRAPVQRPSLGRRRVVLATAATALLAGGGIYASLALPSQAESSDRAGNGQQSAPIGTSTAQSSTPDSTLTQSTTPNESALPVLPTESIRAEGSTDVVKPLTTISKLGRQPQGVTVSPDGTRAFVASMAGDSISVIDTKAMSLLRTIKVSGSPQYIAIAPDGGRLYVTLNTESDSAKSVQVLDAGSGKLLDRFQVGKELFAPAVSPDGLLLYVPDYASSQIVVIDTSNYKVQTRIPVAEGPQEVVFAPDGLQAYAVNTDASLVTVLDVKSSTVTGTVPVGINPGGLAISPDGRQLAVANFDSDSVSLIDVTRQRVTATVKVRDAPQGIAFAPDGKHVYVANLGNDNLSVINTERARVSSTIDVGGDPWRVAVTPDGKQIYITNAVDNSATVLRAAD